MDNLKNAHREKEQSRRGKSTLFSGLNRHIIQQLFFILIAFTFIPTGIVLFSVIKIHQDILMAAGIMQPADLAKIIPPVVAVLIVVLCVAIILILWISSRISRPIDTLFRAAERIGKDNFNEPITLPPTEEFSDLAAALNHAMDEVRKRRERDELLTSQKNEFLTILAHQLRTPLTEIKWGLSSLSGGSESDRGKVKSVNHSAEHLIELITTLLDVIAMEEGRFQYRFELVDFDALARAMVEAKRPRAEMRGVTLTLTTPQQTGRVFLLDRERIRFAIENLLTNAIDYTPQGETVTVEIRVDSEAQVSFCVTNHGVVIPSEEQKQLFTKFFRGNIGQKERPEAMGLGLFIVRNIAREHLGSITVNSDDRNGTRFCLTLPMRTTLPKDASPHKPKLILQDFLSAI